MAKAFTILIADRNPHILQFLRRELTVEGYTVLLAKTGKEIVENLRGGRPLHAIILDPDLRDMGGVIIIKMISENLPKVPVIIHTFSTQLFLMPPASGSTLFVEKNGNSIQRIKEILPALLLADAMHHSES